MATSWIKISRKERLEKGTDRTRTIFYKDAVFLLDIQTIGTIKLI